MILLVRICLISKLCKNVMLTQNFRIYVHEANKTFLVPDKCRATVRNGNSIATNVIQYTIENDKGDACSALFKQFGSCFGLLDIAG